jgi:putative SOS response-associated peptidase YedK
MPVILEPHDYSGWMDRGNEDPAALLKPFAAKTLELYPVSSAVNSPRNDSPACIERRAPDEQGL